MNEIYYDLDGTENGIIALDQNGKVIKVKKLKDKYLFKNIDLLKAAMENNKIDYDDIAILINNSSGTDRKIIPISKILKHNNEYYEYIDLANEEFSYFYNATNNEKLLMSGYFNFTDSPTVKIENYEEGVKVSNQTYGAVLAALANEQRKGNVCKTEVDDLHSLALFLTKRRIKNTTLHIRVMRVFELVKVNNFRKSALESKVFPFDSTVDKYKNVYFAISKYEDETLPDNVLCAIMYKELNEMEAYLQENFADLNPKYTINNTRHIDLWR